MGLLNRFSSIIKQKVNTLLDKFEDPREALDYSYEKQLDMLNNLRRSIVEITASRKRLEMQKAKLWDNTHLLDDQARRALDANREDLARLALERKNANLLNLQSLDKQIVDMQEEEQKIIETEKRLSAKAEEFKTRKEVMKAQFSAEEAQVKIKESVAGISEEMTDAGISIQKAEVKTEKIKAKSEALDDMINSGVLSDYTSNKDQFNKELEKITVQRSVDEELAKLKSERERKKRQQVE